MARPRVISLAFPRSPRETKIRREMKLDTRVPISKLRLRNFPARSFSVARARIRCRRKLARASAENHTRSLNDNRRLLRGKVISLIDKQ